MSKIHLFLNEIKLESCGEVRISVVLCVWCQCHWRRLNKNSLMMLALPVQLPSTLTCETLCAVILCENVTCVFPHYSYKNSLNLGNYSTLTSSATGEIYGIWWHMSTSSGPNKYPLCKTYYCKNKWKYQKLTYSRSKRIEKWQYCSSHSRCFLYSTGSF